MVGFGDEGGDCEVDCIVEDCVYYGDDFCEDCGLC